MPKTTHQPWERFLRLILVVILCLTWQSGITQAQPGEKPVSLLITEEENYESELIYAWDEEATTIAWSEEDRVIILDTIQHTTNILQLPLYPNLVRVVLDLGFSPTGTKVHTISLVDEPQIGSSIMEIYILNLDGTIIAKNVLPNLAKATWLTEDKLKLTIYTDLDWEHEEILYWNLPTGEISTSETEKIEADN